MSNEQSIKIDVRMDQDNLYLEESFTDLKAGSIRRLTPVMPDGLPDKKRKIFFMAQTQLMTQAGLIPIQCEIEAQTLKEAMEKFPAAVNEAVEKLVERANEMRRQEASRIIVPGSEMRNIHMK
ncbi:MAG: cytoplasmic protein [Desulfobacterales bacterium]|nr:cytoplasmic protein [Desulfobacterales bacterium]